jgi:heptosyltransferase-2
MGELAVGLHPGGNLGFSRSRCWGVRHFAELTDLLIAEHDASVFIFCSEGDCFIAERIERLVRNPGRTTVVRGRRLREIAAIVQQMDLFVGNNSSLMHIASAVGVPTIGLFGSTDPRLTGPRGSNTWAVRLDLPCSPCFEMPESGRSSRCANRVPLACIRRLEPQLVMGPIARILEGQREEDLDDPRGDPHIVSICDTAVALDSKWRSVSEEILEDLTGGHGPESDYVTE